MKPQLILTAGPFRSGTDGVPARITGNLSRLECTTLAVYKRGRWPRGGGWVSIPVGVFDVHVVCGAIARVPGVIRASVNLVTERATIEAESAQVQAGVADAIRSAGYEVPESELVLNIWGMTCASCVARVERVLGKATGVSSVSVNLATEQASAKAVTSISPDFLIGAVRKAGYDAAISVLEPVQPKRDMAALKVAGAAIFSVPLLAPMVAQWFGAHLMLPSGSR
jgi:Cu+-exporting ATPase